MSIYAVSLYKWYAKDKDQAKMCRFILKYTHCAMCGGKPNFRTAIADHSLPWGYYNDIWCTQRCQAEYGEMMNK